jgi:hypothetical protein
MLHIEKRLTGEVVRHFDLQVKGMRPVNPS